MKRKPLTEQLQVAQRQGATHYWYMEMGVVRVYRYRGNRWQGKSLDVNNDGCMFYGAWRDLPGNLPQPAQYIANITGGE